LQVLDRKLEWLAEHAEFGVTINSVLGAGIRKPEDALMVAGRARSLGFTSTVGILRDHSGQLQPLGDTHRGVYEQFMRHKDALFSFAHFDSFQQNISRGLANDWHCRAGGRFLYICEDGLVHYCSQQRGKPGIPLENYGLEDLRREAGNAGRDTGAPPGSLSHFRAPAAVRALAWMFLDAKRRGFFGKLRLAALGIKRKPATADFDGP
jgi:hypothetical protein